MTPSSERRDELDPVIDRAAARLITPVDDPAFAQRVIGALPDRRNAFAWRLPMPAWQIALALIAVASASLYVNRPVSIPRLAAPPLADNGSSAWSPFVRGVAPALVSAEATDTPTRVDRRDVRDRAGQRQVNAPDWGISALAAPAALTVEAIVIRPLDLEPGSVAPLQIGDLTVAAVAFSESQE
jgi:hypothetical protein